MLGGSFEVSRRDGVVACAGEVGSCFEEHHWGGAAGCGGLDSSRRRRHACRVRGGAEAVEGEFLLARLEEEPCPGVPEELDIDGELLGGGYRCGRCQDLLGCLPVAVGPLDQRVGVVQSHVGAVLLQESLGYLRAAAGSCRHSRAR